MKSMFNEIKISKKLLKETRKNLEFEQRFRKIFIDQLERTLK